MREQGTIRLLVLLVAALAVVSLVVSCGEDGGEPEKKADTSQETTAKGTTAKESTARPEKTTPPREATEGTTAPEFAVGTSSPPAKLDEGNGKDEFDASVTVTKVVDGDTVDITPALEGKDRVRLIGVDTPETKKPGCEKQPYGEQASSFTESSLSGQEVGLEFDVEKTDRYGRLLAYVYKDGVMFNETLLEEGYAQVATFPPNVKYVDRFLAAQEAARTAGKGLWGQSAEELAAETDRGNGIGGGGCAPNATAPPQAPPPPPPPPPTPTPTPDVPSAPAANGGSYPPISQNSCPANAPIKGNQQSGIYHVPSGQFYGRTNPEACFASEGDAQAAGYRKSQQ